MPKVVLRPIRMVDAELCFRWVSDPDVTRYLGLLQPPTTVEGERVWIARALTDKEQQRVFVVEDQEGRAIGTGGLRAMDRETGSAILGVMIGDKSIWNQGYGTSATKALVSYGFGELGLQEVRLSCHPENYGALRCYEKAGFKVSKRPGDRSVYGRAEVQMSVRRQDWEQADLSPSAGPGEMGHEARG
jgi:RimJ/RimL family protein N-acetyltransferase